MQALGSLGVDKIFGEGQTGGFLIPQNKVKQLIKYKDWLTEEQKKQIVEAIHTGGQVVIKPNRAQEGGFLGTLLASIGGPLLLNALTGEGLQVDRKRPKSSIPVYVPNPVPVKRDGGLILPVDYGWIVPLKDKKGETVTEAFINQYLRKAENHNIFALIREMNIITNT